MWILPENVVFEMLNADTTQMLGFGLETTPTAEEQALPVRAGERLQRWLLFLPSTKSLSTHKNLLIRPTTNAAWRDKNTANTFIRKATDTFMLQRDMYAVVNFVRTTPAHIADAMNRAVPFPRTPPPGDQMDFRIARIIRVSKDNAGNITGKVVAGLVNGKAEDDVVTQECWALFDAYPPSAAAATTEYRIENLRDVETTDFLDLLTGVTWNTQAASALIFGRSAYFVNAVAESPGPLHGA